MVSQSKHTQADQVVLFDFNVVEGLPENLITAAMSISLDDEIEAALADLPALGELVSGLLNELPHDHM